MASLNVRITVVPSVDVVGASVPVVTSRRADAVDLVPGVDRHGAVGEDGVAGRANGGA